MASGEGKARAARMTYGEATRMPDGSYIVSAHLDGATASGRGNTVREAREAAAAWLWARRPPEPKPEVNQWHRWPSKYWR